MAAAEGAQPTVDHEHEVVRGRTPAVGSNALIRQVLKEEWRWMALALGLSALGFVVQFALGNAAIAVIDKGVQDRSADLGELVVRMGVLGVVQVTLTWLGILLMTKVRWQIEYRVRNVMHRSLLAGAVNDTDVSTGQVVTRAVADLGQLKAVVYVVPIIVAGVPGVLSGAAYLGSIDWRLMLVTFVCIPVNLAVVWGLRTRVGALSWFQLQETAEVTAAIDEPIRGIRVVKLFGRELDVVTRVRVASLSAYRYALTRVIVLSRYGAILRIIPALSQAALLFLGARFVSNGERTAGEFLVFFAGSAQVVYYATSFVSILDQFSLARSGSSRIGDLVDPDGDGVARRMRADDARVEAVDPFGPASLGWHADGVVLHGAEGQSQPLTFAVPPGTLAVLRVPPAFPLGAVGDVLAGSGEPQSGQVNVEGINVHDVSARARQAQVRVLDSEPYLFSRSVRDNLVLGARGSVPDDQQLRAALAACCADDVVAMLPDGLDEVLGDRALNLSGGQRQRLALAQAVLARPRVLVLVEALSGVHGGMEAEILRRLRTALPATSLLYVTTRPAAGSTADLVIEIEVATGSTTSRRRQAGGAVGGGDRPPVDVDVVPEEVLCGREAELDDRTPTFGNLIKPFRHLLPKLMLAMLVITAVGLTPQYIFGSTNNAITEQLGGTDRFAVALVAFVTIGALVNWWFEKQASRLSNGMLYLLRVRLVRRLVRLGLAYYDRELPGYVATRVLHDLAEITAFAKAVATRLAVVVLSLLGAVIAMSVIGVQILAVIVGIIAAAALATLIQMPIARRAFLRERVALGHVIARLEEDYNGRAAIEAADAHTDAEAGFEALTDDLRRAERWSATVSISHTMAIQWIAEIGGALILWRAGQLVIVGALAFGTMLTLRLYLTAVLNPVMELGNLWQQFLKARVSFDRLRQPYEAEILPVDAAGAGPCAALRGDVAFEGVGFRYPGTERVVLSDVDVVIPAGQTVAVVGPTGAGKSTFAKLLTRVYDPDEGAVTVGGESLRSFTVDAVRQRIGVVPQESFLFAGTVADNVSYGRPGTPRAALLEAVRAVGGEAALAHLHDGLDTVVLEEGINLTPQERQVVALARAWLMQPDILVLDEATSSLDERTERGVLDALRCRTGTTIFVTHRDQVMAAADQVLVVDDDGPRLRDPGSAEALAASHAS